MPKRDFLALPDLSTGEINHLMTLAEQMKGGDYTDTPLAGKTLAMVFTKSSTRIRVFSEGP